MIILGQAARVPVLLITGHRGGRTSWSETLSWGFRSALSAPFAGQKVMLGSQRACSHALQKFFEHSRHMLVE